MLLCSCNPDKVLRALPLTRKEDPDMNIEHHIADYLLQKGYKPQSIFITFDANNPNRAQSVQLQAVYPPGLGGTLAGDHWGTTYTTKIEGDLIRRLADIVLFTQALSTKLPPEDVAPILAQGVHWGSPAQQSSDDPQLRNLLQRILDLLGA